jgi:hypothetical protein
MLAGALPFKIPLVSQSIYNNAIVGILILLDMSLTNPKICSYLEYQRLTSIKLLKNQRQMDQNKNILYINA